MPNILDNRESMKIATGFTDLDKALSGGFPKSSLVVIGSRPAMGKSTLMHDLAIAMKKDGKPLKIYRLENTDEQVIEKTKGQLEKSDFGPYTRRFGHLLDCLELDAQNGIKVFLIDYLQLIFHPHENQHQSISEIVNSLKSFSMQHECLVVITSQLNRRPEDRQGHRPQLSDLRDSGCIEEDADLVILILRREYYDPQDKPGMAELIIAKNRYGEKSSVHMAFNRTEVSFRNYIPMVYTPEEESEAVRAFSQFMPV